ncbi:MAG TPA: TldD/PmbA family protein [Methanocella sp.]
MIDRAKKLVDLALKLGASDAEVYASSGKIVNVETVRGDLGYGEESISEGLGVRVIVSGAEGYSSSNDHTRFEAAVRAAIECAKARPADPDLKGLPGPRQYRNVRGVFDERVQEMKLDQCMDIAAGMIEAAKEDKGASVTFGKFQTMISDVVIVNSRGISVEDRETVVTGYADVIIKEGDRVSTAFEYDISRSVDIDMQAVGRKASQLARSSIMSEPVYEQTCDVLLGPHAFGDILESTFLSSINSENVQKGRSGLAGKIGQKIATDGLTIIDDGLLDGGLGTAKSDDEGVPSRTTTILDDGVLKTFLYDTYTAGKENRESTGNAIRGSYSSPPQVGPRNIRFEYPRSDVIKETDKGLYVNSIIGAHTANPISGDFSVECRNAFVIENGVLTQPIKSMMISGNIFELLKKVDAMGRDEKAVGSIISPTVRVKDIRVTPGA